MVDGTATTDRLLLEPLSAGHAEEMADVLSAPGLHRHTGGQPPTRRELLDRFTRLAAGSPDPAEEWTNWVMRRRSDGRAVGWLQATLAGVSEGRAELAWMVGATHQGQGFATEAARWLLAEAARRGAVNAVASIAPGNAASEAVARRLGMTAGTKRADGEVLWSCPVEVPSDPPTQSTAPPTEAYEGDDFYCDVAFRDTSALHIVRETSRVLAYHHTRPYWPVHIVVERKRHIASLTAVEQEDERDVRELLEVVQQVAGEVEREHGAARVLTNLGRYQDSKHLHVHVASGDPLGEAEG